MSGGKHTPGPWRVGPVDDTRVEDANGNEVAQIDGDYNHPDTWPLMEANARLIAAAPDLLAALHEGRRAIGDHFAPNDCYATGPLTGNHYRDLVECPACSFIAIYEAAIAKAEGGAA
jgi:hypothetical protein